MSESDKRSKKAKPCPTCGGPSTKKARPFCSKRCADIDLGRWLQGKYAVAAVDAADDSIIEVELAASEKQH